MAKRLNQPIHCRSLDVDAEWDDVFLFQKVGVSHFYRYKFPLIPFGRVNPRFVRLCCADLCQHLDHRSVLNHLELE